MSDFERAPGPGRRMPVEHQVFSDGLASVSVFIEKLGSVEDRLEGTSSMGAMSAYGRVMDDYQVTVVGEVPLATVRGIGESVTRR